MRTAKWSAAAFVVLVSAAIVGLAGPMVRAADTVTMGSDAEPFALKFFPAQITVPVGSTVKWENKSDLQHDVNADNGSFKSPLLNKGETFEFRFTSPGEFTYICTPHVDAGMTGVVKVVGGSTPAPAPAPAPAPPAPTPTTRAAAAGGPAPSPTTTTARAGQPTTTTTAGNAAAPAATTQTTAGEATPGLTPTSAPGVTPTSPPEDAAEPTAAGHGTEEAAAGGDHASRGASEQNRKTNPLAVVFAGLSTVILIGITGKLLASKS